MRVFVSNYFVDVNVISKNVFFLCRIELEHIQEAVKGDGAGDIMKSVPTVISSATKQRKARGVKRNVDVVGDALVDMLEERKKRQDATDDDAYLLYFQSQAYRYKKLPASKKGMFQIRLAELFYRDESGQVQNFLKS